MEKEKAIQSATMRLVETGGRTSQDLGAGRIVGQILVYLYLQEHECSLDKIGDELGLSKASVSIAVRQLEQLGLIRKVWKKGDRKNYFKSADNIASALQIGILSLVRKKVQIFGDELETAGQVLMDATAKDCNIPKEIVFLNQRVARAKKLQKRLRGILDNPLLSLLAGRKDT